MIIKPQKYLILFILLLLWNVNVLYAKTIKSHECVKSATCVNTQDILLLTKRYHYGEYSVSLKRYADSPEDYEVYYICEVFKKGSKKHLVLYKNDFIEIMDTPYKFPYVVMHEADLREENAITLLDFSHGFRVVQRMGGTRINYDRLKSRRSPFLWDEKNSFLFSSYNNPIVLGNDGAYYMETSESVGYAKCNACQNYEKVLYRFNGKKFTKYKHFVWNENSTKKINAIIWGDRK